MISKKALFLVLVIITGIVVFGSGFYLLMINKETEQPNRAILSQTKPFPPGGDIKDTKIKQLEKKVREAENVEEKKEAIKNIINLLNKVEEKDVWVGEYKCITDTGRLLWALQWLGENGIMESKSKIEEIVKSSGNWPNQGMAWSIRNIASVALWKINYKIAKDEKEKEKLFMDLVDMTYEETMAKYRIATDPKEQEQLFKKLNEMGTQVQRKRDILWSVIEDVVEEGKIEYWPAIEAKFGWMREVSGNDAHKKEQFENWKKKLDYLQIKPRVDGLKKAFIDNNDNIKIWATGRLRKEIGDKEILPLLYKEIEKIEDMVMKVYNEEKIPIDHSEKLKAIMREKCRWYNHLFSTIVEIGGEKEYRKLLEDSKEKIGIRSAFMRLRGD